MGIYKRPDSMKWWISYYHNGKRIREPVSIKKSEAEKVLTQRLNAINEGKHPVIKKRKSKKIKFAAFAETYITDYSKPNKRSWKSDVYRLKALIPFFGDFYFSDIESSHVPNTKSSGCSKRSKTGKSLYLRQQSTKKSNSSKTCSKRPPNGKELTSKTWNLI